MHQPSGVFVRFLNDENFSCNTQPLSREESDRLKSAIRHRYFCRLFFDDLPVWAMVGELFPPGSEPFKELLSRVYNSVSSESDNRSMEAEDLAPFLYTQRHLHIFYNKDNRIVQVDLTSDPRSLVAVQENKILTFRMSVTFEARPDESYESRFERYLDIEMGKLYAYSIWGSAVFVIFLSACFCSVLVRTLKKDYARYAALPQADNDDDDEQQQQQIRSVGSVGGDGWRQISGDVFRAPP